MAFPEGLAGVYASHIKPWALRRLAAMKSGTPPSAPAPVEDEKSSTVEPERLSSTAAPRSFAAPHAAPITGIQGQSA